MSDHLELGKWRATHSSPLEMLSEQGLIGLLLWLCIVALAFTACLAGVRSNESWIRRFSVGAACGLAAMLVAGLAISRHDDIRFFWMMGMAFATGATAMSFESNTDEVVD